MIFTLPLAIGIKISFPNEKKKFQLKSHASQFHSHRLCPPIARVHGSIGTYLTEKKKKEKKEKQKIEEEGNEKLLKDGNE